MGKRVAHAYHSSLDEPLSSKARQRFTIGDSVAFVADLARGLPGAFAGCDLLYTEVAWERGYDRFVERAGGGSDYAEYVEALSAIASSAEQPFIVVCGKAMTRLLPAPKTTTAVNLNTGGKFLAEAVALTYRCALPRVRVRHPGWTDLDTENLLRALARTYRRVGDPCCGYGSTGRIFAESGRSYVMSDINASCIGYIAEHAHKWTKS